MIEGMSLRSKFLPSVFNLTRMVLRHRLPELGGGTQQIVQYVSNNSVSVSFQTIENYLSWLIVMSSRFALVRTLNTRTIQAHNVKPGSIGLLPVELLLDIFEQLDRNALLTCMRVCRRWYDIASPYSFAAVPVRHNYCQRFAKHVRAHPGLAEHVRDLYFFDKCWGETGNQRHMEIDCCPFDVQLLASALPFLTNLRNLSIVGYDNKADPARFRRVISRQPQNPATSVALQRLTLESCQNVAFILHGLLPLFTIDTLITDAFLFSLFGKRPPADIGTLFPSASVSIQNLALRGTVEHFYEFFERVLVPGCLRGLATGSWWRGDLRLLDRFLQSRAAQNLVSISIGAVQSLHEPRPHEVRVNPGKHLHRLSSLRREQLT